MTNVGKKQLIHSFDWYWGHFGDPIQPVKEYKFAKKRKFRADYAFVDAKVLVEIEGGIFTNGRHVRGMGYHKDCSKYNLAQELGYVVLRYTVKHIEDDPISMIKQIRKVVKARTS